MNNLSNLQLKTLSEIVGNISVAWFAGGVVTPVFIGTFDLTKIFIYQTLGIFMSVTFSSLSLYIIRNVK